MYSKLFTTITYEWLSNGRDPREIDLFIPLL